MEKDIKAVSNNSQWCLESTYIHAQEVITGVPNLFIPVVEPKKYSLKGQFNIPELEK